MTKFTYLTIKPHLLNSLHLISVYKALFVVSCAIYKQTWRIQQKNASIE